MIITRKSAPLKVVDMVVSQFRGPQFRGHHKKGYSILGFILGSPYVGKLITIYCHNRLCLSDNDDFEAHRYAGST